MAALGCAYKARLGVLWCVGVTVIVHSCMHNEHQPSAGFILDHPFLLDFFSLLATLSTFKNKKRGSGCSQLLSGAGRESSAPQGRAQSSTE